MSDVEGFEELGRCVVSRRITRKARTREVHYRSFPAVKGQNRLSADRLCVAPPDEAVRNGERVAQARQDGIVRTNGVPSDDVHFCGWSVITARRVRASRCEAVASPTSENQYHTDIVLPEQVKTDNDERKAVAQRLGTAAFWRDRTSTSPDEPPAVRISREA